MDLVSECFFMVNFGKLVLPSGMTIHMTMISCLPFLWYIMTWKNEYEYNGNFGHTLDGKSMHISTTDQAISVSSTGPALYA